MYYVIFTIDVCNNDGYSMYEYIYYHYNVLLYVISIIAHNINYTIIVHEYNIQLYGGGTILA